MQRTLVLATVVLLAVAARAAEPARQPMLGEPAPAFSLADLQGKTQSLADLRGRLVVLHFGASW